MLFSIELICTCCKFSVTSGGVKSEYMILDLLMIPIGFIQESTDGQDRPLLRYRTKKATIFDF